MHVTDPLLLSPWLIAFGLALSLLLGRGLVWRSAVVPLRPRDLPRLRADYDRLHTSLLSLRDEAGHAVRARYDEGLNMALRDADQPVFAVPSPTVASAPHQHRV